jgi:hypothetical protein
MSEKKSWHAWLDKMLDLHAGMDRKQRFRNYFGGLMFALAIAGYFIMEVFSEEVGDLLRRLGTLPQARMLDSEQMAIWGMILSGIGGLILPVLLYLAYKLCTSFFGVRWRLFINGAFIFLAYFSLVFLFCFLYTCQNTLEFYYPESNISTWSIFMETGYFLAIGFIFAYSQKLVFKLVSRITGEKLVIEKKKEDGD